MDYFKNKVVCITGSSKGIGKETALLLGNSGAKIIINARNAEKLEQSRQELANQKIDCAAYAADVSDPNACKKLIDYCIETYGHLDVLINNAGISARGRFHEVTAETWQKVISINTLGCIYPAVHALPHLLKSKGHLIFISSIGGKIGLPGHSTYSVSKMGLTSLVKALQIEYPKKDLHAGIVYVGFTENEPDKTIMNAKGEIIPLKARDNVKLWSRDRVARAIANMIIKRKKSVTLTFIGKLQGFSLRFFPFVVDLLMKKANRDYDKIYS